jgi:hypothetical protein
MPKFGDGEGGPFPQFLRRFEGRGVTTMVVSSSLSSSTQEAKEKRI